ncbi:protein serine/threonine kinase [Aureococcus anophagefferens]|uniref:non-specific serine/threonine protein kinase n=1 Tax=Aureococcus anophagefferens TaxID=44056 RepID=A0ABR1FT42_AURAN
MYSLQLSLPFTQPAHCSGSRPGTWAASNWCGAAAPRGTMENLEPIKVLGEGAFGKVYLMRHKVERALCCVKVKNIPKKEREACRMEVGLLKRLNHPNIVGYRDSFLAKNKESLCIARAPRRTADARRARRPPARRRADAARRAGHAILRRRRPVGADQDGALNRKLFAESKILHWFVQMALGLHYMHAQRVLHRDLKTQNLPHGQRPARARRPRHQQGPRGDHGLCATCIGTPYYMSPARAPRAPVAARAGRTRDAPAGDLQEQAVLVQVRHLGPRLRALRETTTLNHAFDANSLNGLACKIIKGRYPPIASRYSKSLRDLVSGMLSTSPSSRPQLEAILRKPFVKKHIKDFLTDIAKRDAGKIGDGTMAVKAAALCVVTDPANAVAGMGADARAARARAGRRRRRANLQGAARARAPSAGPTTASPRAGAAPPRAREPAHGARDRDRDRDPPRRALASPAAAAARRGAARATTTRSASRTSKRWEDQQQRAERDRRQRRPDHGKPDRAADARDRENAPGGGARSTRWVVPIKGGGDRRPADERPLGGAAAREAAREAERARQREVVAAREDKVALDAQERERIRARAAARSSARRARGRARARARAQRERARARARAHSTPSTCTAPRARARRPRPPRLAEARDRDHRHDPAAAVDARARAAREGAAAKAHAAAAADARPGDRRSRRRALAGPAESKPADRRPRDRAPAKAEAKPAFEAYDDAAPPPRRSLERSPRAPAPAEAQAAKEAERVALLNEARAESQALREQAKAMHHGMYRSSSTPPSAPRPDDAPPEAKLDVESPEYYEYRDDDRREEQLKAELELTTQRCEELRKTLHDTKKYIATRTGTVKLQSPTHAAPEAKLESARFAQPPPLDEEPDGAASWRSKVTEEDDDCLYEEDEEDDEDMVPVQTRLPPPQPAASASRPGPIAANLTPRGAEHELTDAPSPTGRLAARAPRPAILGPDKVHFSSLIDQLIFMEDSL